MSRLGADKFMTDGRHTGTGGGNHVVLGGADARRFAVPAPARSPREPRPLLAAPSLAVLSVLRACSSGRPARRRASTKRATTSSTNWKSRSPRRRRPGEGAPLWLVDRLFRNLLVDVTGNTHRAEICIDKLYSPDSATGRLGLVEFRSFRNAARRAHEPRPATAGARARRLVLARAAARRAGALGHQPARSLHAAAFRLGGFSRRSRTTSPTPAMRSTRVVRGAARIPLSRCSAASSTAASNWKSAARSSPGTCWARSRPAAARRAMSIRRSSACRRRREGLVAGPPCRRLQRAQAAADADRHGRRGGRRACASRRGSRPPACTRRSPSHAPLTFDILDAWNGRSLGGCVYHVSHPGGRSYDTSPVNAYEAEARRLARFQDHGHTAGTTSVPADETSSEFPLTLDLRRPIARQR